MESEADRGRKTPAGTYLGLDLSTQQLKAVVIDDRYAVLHEQSVHFDSELPEFRTQGGVVRAARSAVVTANPLMWIKALELLMDKLKIAGCQLGELRAVGGCAQQHGSVYWRRGAGRLLAELDASRFLHAQLQDAFAVRDSPVWMDSSTAAECDQLEQAIGGCDRLAELTGSRAYCRFTGPQIARLRTESAPAYEQTERISLVSSFVASLLLGRFAPIDLSDASGMNLLCLETRDWHDELLRFCGGDRLRALLGKPVPCGEALGKISPYFVNRHGFSDTCQVAAFTGDNPASMVGMCLAPNDLAVSLGTSDTLFFETTHAKPARTGHVLVSPLRPDREMVLVCFKNGSATRERISKECAEGSWTLFGELLDSTPRGNFGNLGLYLDQVEIRPRTQGDHRTNRFDQPVARFSKEVEVRACVEGQFIRLRAHAEQMGFQAPTLASVPGLQDTLNGQSTDEPVKDVTVESGKVDSGQDKPPGEDAQVTETAQATVETESVEASKPTPQARLLVTGGASRNRSLLQVLADVFNCPVYVQPRPNSACFGGALIAKHALSGRTDFAEEVREAGAFELTASPASDSHLIYAEMVNRYLAIERLLDAQSK